MLLFTSHRVLLLLSLVWLTASGSTAQDQTLASHDLTPNLAAERKLYHLQKGVGHYGVFNGSRFRANIAPRISTFMHEMQGTQAVADLREAS